MLKLPHSGPIAQAVAGEIDRLTDFTSSFQQSEGAAYKAAWDRQGSDALKHYEAFRRDCLIASLKALMHDRSPHKLFDHDEQAPA